MLFKFIERNFRWLIALLAVGALCGYDFIHFNDASKEDPFRNGQARYLMLAMVPLITWGLSKANPFWALFFGWSFALWIFGNWQSFGMMDLFLIYGCLIVGDYIRCTFKQSEVFRVVAWLAVAQAVYCISQRLGFDPLFEFVGRFENEAIGTIGHFTMVGAFIGLGAVHFFAEGFAYGKTSPRLLNEGMIRLWGFIVCCLGIYLCHSTMAILGTAAGLLWVVYTRCWRMSVVLSFLGVSSLGIWKWMRPGAEFFGFSGREVVWPYVIREWLKNPIFGHGPGYWAGALPTFDIQGTGGDKWYQAHNDFIQVLPEQGLIGLAIVLVGLAVFFLTARKLDARIGGWGAAIAVGALGNFLMHMVCFGLIAGWLASASFNHAARRVNAAR